MEVLRLTPEGIPEEKADFDVYIDKRLEQDFITKSESLRYARFLRREGYQTLSGKMAKCADFIEYRYHQPTGKKGVSHMQTCKKHLLCPTCAVRRAVKYHKAFQKKIEALLASDPCLKPYLVTFTVKNGDDLAERFRHLKNAMARYNARRTGTHQHGEVRKASAGVFTYEVTHSPDKGWHPHVHAIWLCHQAPNPFKLSSEWLEVTKDSRIVDVRRLRQGEDGTYFDSLGEVFKYVVKPGQLCDSDRLHVYKTLKGKHLIQCLGALRGVEVEDEDEAEDDDEYIERLYRFYEGQGYSQIDNSQFVAAKHQKHEVPKGFNPVKGQALCAVRNWSKNHE